MFSIATEKTKQEAAEPKRKRKPPEKQKVRRGRTKNPQMTPSRSLETQAPRHAGTEEAATVDELRPYGATRKEIGHRTRPATLLLQPFADSRAGEPCVSLMAAFLTVAYPLLRRGL
ncbi:hypothetical protein MRX96_002598 [Rhipicephalus microplus]